MATNNGQFKKKIIVSMTSYPARIECVAPAFRSILNQNVDRRLYKCMLALARPEFPGGKADLPPDLVAMVRKKEIELVWTETNTRSHKKLMPALKKYPTNPILITDDDVIRQPGWLQMFIDDHDRYPDDIICGAFGYFFGVGNRLIRFDNRKQKAAGSFNDVPDIVFNTARPANGTGGVLYPAGTFTDPRFFDEDLYMRLSPTSDESWQFCFNIMADRTIRQSSKIFDNSASYIPGTQSMPTALHKVNDYGKINDTLFSYFPEYAKKLDERRSRVVVSLTSYGDRIQYLPAVINSLYRQTVQPYRIVVCLDVRDRDRLTSELSDYLSDPRVDLIWSDEPCGDLKPHKKYYYAMMKYRGHAVITVDDDSVYTPDLIESLTDAYMKNPSRVCARRVHLIRYSADRKPLPYKNWGYDYTKAKAASAQLIATGCGGILYPPDALNICPDDLSSIMEYVNADDIWLKKREFNKGIKTVYVPNEKRLGDPILEAQHNDSALYKQNVKNGGNDRYVSMIGFPYSDDVEKTPGVPDDAVPDPPAVISFTSVNPAEEIRLYNEAVKFGVDRFVIAPSRPVETNLIETPADPVVVEAVKPPVVVRTVLKFAADPVDSMNPTPVPEELPKKRPSTFRFTDGNIQPVLAQRDTVCDGSDKPDHTPSKLDFTSGVTRPRQIKPIKRIVFK